MSTGGVLETALLERDQLQALFDALRRRGYGVVGPTLRDGAIVYDELASADALPVGWTDEQRPATYRLRRRDDQARFGYAVGPHSWKRFLFPAHARLWSASRDREGTLRFTDEPLEQRRYAFLGVRSCELHAIAIQDQVFAGGPYADQRYRALREAAFLVAVQCTEAGGTCFCASMGTGPQAAGGYDLALTEVIGADRHYFVVQAGSERGGEVLGELPHRAALTAEREAADAAVARCAASMGRALDTSDIHGLLTRNYEHPRWDDVAQRCLSCGNCTLACPTCFCSSVAEVSDLVGDRTERWRSWDSCFTGDFSYLHGGSVRESVRSRYRQWMTHKLATWIDQFGMSGCVGCGRCITWCPVGIDITEEVRAIRKAEERP